MSNPVVYCEATKRPIDYLPKGTTEVPQRLREVYGDRLIIVSVEQAYQRQQDAAKTPVEEITERKWTYALEVLPPMAWRNTGTRESFKMSEFVVGDVTAIYVRLGGGGAPDRYFTFHDVYRLSHEQCCDRVVDAVCRDKVKWANEGNPRWHEIKTDPFCGRIWWVFDSEQELEEWRTKVGDDPWRGSKHLRVLFVDRNIDPPRLHVFFEIEKAKANEVLGYEVGEEEWLED